MSSKKLLNLLILALLLIGVMPVAVAADPPQPATEPVNSAGAAPAAPAKPAIPEDGGVASLSGSFVAFDPAVGGDMCFVPGATQTFCFEAHSYTNDYEYVYNLWTMFPTDWAVLNVYVQGTPACSSGASWGAFSWSFQTAPYEVNIAHSRFQAPTDDCVAYYCFEVVSGAGGADALESWYWDGDGYGNPPHWPCSDDQYTPAGQSACDEYVNPQAAVPECLPGLFLSPDEINVDGCAALPQVHTFNLWNNTGADGTFSLAYDVPSGNGTLTGPDQIYLGNGVNQVFEVELTPDDCLPEGAQVIATIEADGNGYTDVSTINKTIMGEIAGWESVPDSAPGWAGGGYPVDGCAAMNGNGEWVTYVIGDQSSYAGFWGYNHNTNTWYQPAGNPPADRWAPDWAYDADTNLCYMTGGANLPGGGTYAEAWQYDPVADAWTQLPNFTSIRDFHNSWVGTLNGTKYLCIGGGVNASSVLVQATQCYDIAGGTWNAENADMDAYPTDPFGAADGTLHADSGDQFWYVGGAKDNFATVTDEVWAWDDADDSWHNLGNTGVPRYRVEGDFKHGDFYQLAGSSGGFTPTTTAVRGEYVGGTWVWEPIEDLPLARMDNVAVMIPPYTLAGWKPAEPEAVYNPDAVADLAGGAEPAAPPAPEGTSAIWAYPEAVLWDNGPLVTLPGACAGMDASRLQTGLLMNTLGFGHQFIYGYRMADDFEIADPGGWNIDQITFFAYQTGAPADPSPITGVYYQIWDGPPDDPGSSVVFGDLVTNRLLSSTSPNMQRDSETSPCANNRYIFADEASAGLWLPPGTYWLDWTTDGSLASGPWAPPITIIGQTTTGNALQYTGAWAPALDSGTATQQGMPFIIEGSAGGPPPETMWSVTGYGGSDDDYVAWLVQCPACEQRGWLDGHVMDSETGDVDPTCTDAVVHIEPGNLDVLVDPLTGYFGPVELISGTYTVDATAPGYSLETEVVDVTDQMTTTVDFNLWRPVIEVTPTEFISISVNVGESLTLPLIISNLGHLPLDFEIAEIPPGMTTVEAPRSYKPSPAAVGVDPFIYEELATSPDGQVDFFVAFRDTADLAPAYAMNWSDRGHFVVAALQTAANAAQRDVRAWLDARGIEYTSFWINNTLFLHADEATLNALAAFPEVSGFRGNHVNQIMPVEAQETTGQTLAPAYPWNITFPMADQVHADFGIKGQSVVIGGMDTGAEYTHMGLVNNYRGNLGGGSFDHTYSWFDPANQCGGTPCDTHGHGTATMGIMAGDDDPALPTGAWIGMAPDAQWIHCVGCPGGSCPDNVTDACAQWFLAPGGDADMRPQVVNHSWGTWTPNSCEGNDFQAQLMAYRAADIVPAFAAGNVGDYVYPPHCYASTSPANNTDPAGNPIAFSTGAHGPAGLLDYYSSGGPSACNNANLFPDVAAPGSGSCTTGLGNTYNCSFGGTSSASPHTAGCVALVRQANPLLTVDEVEQVIRDAANDVDDGCGTPPESPDWNNKYGEGHLDCYEAVEMVFQQDLPWTSVDPVSGTIPAEDEALIDVTFTCTETGDLTGALRIMHNDPCIDDIGIPLEIHCVECVPVHDVAVSLVTIGTIYTGDLVEFSADIMPDNADKPYNYTIDYDDGTQDSGSSSDDPLLFDHTYTAAGTYMVEVAVWNCDMAEPVVGTVEVVVECEAVDGLAFTWAPETPAVGEPVSFEATEPLMGTPPFIYTWDFGDGFGDVGQTVNHAYGAADDYEVTLTVENACGEASITDTVTVEMGMHYVYLPIVVKNNE